ncbi:hypothetical protein KFK09_012319 [Dendrobium nobile]|uniref:Uncharacterized protein n=1 Tax=Dendrobium nobile TaxID=94219 RepID=A0A8T3BHJ6_DENNO|nr:hypothetical protein KFK09_012319 [Dendrobium nobile]
MFSGFLFLFPVCWVVPAFGLLFWGCFLLLLFRYFWDLSAIRWDLWWFMYYLWRYWSGWVPFWLVSPFYLRICVIYLGYIMYLLGAIVSCDWVTSCIPGVGGFGAFCLILEDFSVGKGKAFYRICWHVGWFAMQGLVCCGSFLFRWWIFMLFNEIFGLIFSLRFLCRYYYKQGRFLTKVGDNCFRSTADREEVKGEMRLSQRCGSMSYKVLSILKYKIFCEFKVLFIVFFLCFFFLLLHFCRKRMLNVYLMIFLFWVAYDYSPIYFFYFFCNSCNLRMRNHRLAGLFLFVLFVARLSSRELVVPFKDHVTAFLVLTRRPL